MFVLLFLKPYYLHRFYYSLSNPRIPLRFIRGYQYLIPTGFYDKVIKSYMFLYDLYS